MPTCLSASTKLVYWFNESEVHCERGAMPLATTIREAQIMETMVLFPARAQAAWQPAKNGAAIADGFFLRSRCPAVVTHR
jgi:hypothetical protein